MKLRFVAWLAALALMFMGIGALAEADVDLSGLSLEALYDLRTRLNDEIADREAGESAVYEAGTYVVGREIPEGDYLLLEMEDAIFAGVMVRADDSDDSELITYKLVSHQAIIHLAENTWVTFNELRAWPLAGAPEIGVEDAASHEGAYLVGAQLPPGRYAVTATDKAPLSSYSVYDGILGTDADLTKFEVLKADGEVELSEGDYIELSGCTIAPVE